MTYNSFKYSVRVWLCTVVPAPVIYFIGAYFHQNIQNDPLASYAEPCLVFACFESICSIAALLIFWFAVELVLWLIERNLLRKFLLSLIGISLAIATFQVLTSVLSFSLSGNSLILMVINCACIGIACWCFRPEPKRILSRVNPYMYTSDIPSEPVSYNPSRS